MSQIILLLSSSYVAHSDMPLPCGLPEGKTASLLPPEDDNVVSEFLCLKFLTTPRCPVSERCCWYLQRELTFRFMS